jgi:amidophosphoribosyltransferase
MRRIVSMLREAGAREVHVRIGSPPIVAPCYLGIDMNTRKQLVAAEHGVDEICKIIGADSLSYISLEGLVEAIGHRRSDLCTGCLTGVYPVEIPGEKHRVQSTLF